MPVVVPSEEASDGAGTRRATQPRFAFGRNWSQFVQLVDDARIESAVRWVREMVGGDDLSGRRFLDGGSGSGLFARCCAPRGRRSRVRLRRGLRTSDFTAACAVRAR